ncbi:MULTISPECIES: hypothetical protein [Clavibacter]|uniref:Uncharacterized protein n=2 Tax=Clavibacter TaxID=1573 RepID=A0A399NR78_9MICO|nr:MULTISPECIES: hypothetical protein [Clavibacter]KDP90753.1 hypothetical protein W824_11530 [Clavibacter cf. michiganensis LMG 26808]RII96683.1 hypothetical protein DZF96_10415 [Clavibacter michiganensis]UKF23814.1 hypothetical protein KYT88_08700 [Clavibacter sp. A6099]
MSSTSLEHRSAARPTTVTAAFWLVLLSAAVAAVSAFLAIQTLLSAQGSEELRRTIEATPEAAGGDIDMDSLVGIARATAVAIQVLLIVVSMAIALWIAFAMRSGRAYIRVVAVVLSVFQAVGTVTAPSPASVVSLALIVAALVLIWAPASSRYVARRTAGRRRPQDPAREPSFVG